jgi:predicted nicotinamide N-methyase
VTFSDTDPAAAVAVVRNAAANGVTIGTGAGDPEVLLAGDAFYSARVAGEMTALLLAAQRNETRILVGDPGRGYFPDRLFDRLAEYPVPVSAALEDAETLVTAVWEMRATMHSSTNKL